MIETIRFFSALLRGRLLSFIAWLGRASLGIYVMHILAVAGTRILLIKTGLVTDATCLLAITSLAGLVGPLAALALLERLQLTSALGLGASARPRRRVFI